MNLRLNFNGGKHKIMHEYHTYETYSFIADIGGYMVRIIKYPICDHHSNIYKFSGFMLGC